MYFSSFCYRSCVYSSSFIEQFGPVWTHLMNNDRSCTMNTSSKICLPIVIPEKDKGLPTFLHDRHFLNGLHGSSRVYSIRHINNAKSGVQKKTQNFPSWWRIEGARGTSGIVFVCIHPGKSKREYTCDNSFQLTISQIEKGLHPLKNGSQMVPYSIYFRRG